MSSASSPSSPNTLISPSNWDPKSFAHWGHNEDTYDGNNCDGDSDDGNNCDGDSDDGNNCDGDSDDGNDDNGADGTWVGTDAGGDVGDVGDDDGNFQRTREKGQEEELGIDRLCDVLQSAETT